LKGILGLHPFPLSLFLCPSNEGNNFILYHRSAMMWCLATGPQVTGPIHCGLKPPKL
jgi:hypothetical protein